MQRGFSAIIIVIGITILAGVAYGAYYLGRSTSSRFNSQTTIASSSPQPTDLANQKSNWKTYQVESYEFSYPPEWGKTNSDNSPYWDNFNVIEIKFNELPYDKDLDKSGLQLEIVTKERFLEFKNSIEEGKLPTGYTNTWRFIKVGTKDAIQAFVYDVSGGVYMIQTQIFTDKVGLRISGYLPIQTVFKTREPGQEYDTVDIPKSQQIEAELNAGTYKNAEVDKIVEEYKNVLSTFKFN